MIFFNKIINKLEHFFRYHFILELFISTFFILTIFASKIPASNGTFQIKLSIFPILLFLSFLLFIINNKTGIICFFSKSELKNLFLLVIAFVIYHSIGLLYSKNIYYGLQKFYGIIFNIIPIIIFTYILIKTWNKRRTEAFIFSLSTIIFFSVIYIFIVFPFNYGNVRSISTNSWSHVYYGRFISLSYILFLIIFLKNYTNKNNYLIITLLLFSGVGTFLSGLRAAEIGIIIFTLWVGTYFYITKKTNLTKIFLAIVVILISFSVVTFLSNHKLSTRQNDLVKLTQFKIKEVSSLNARIKGIEAGITMFNESPIIGVGLGGFNNKEYGEILADIKYPHNIFLEYLFEFGLIGLIIFSIILIILFRKLNSISKDILFILLFTIWLALFSHDISSQKEFFLFFIFFIINKNELKIIRKYSF